MFMRSVYFVVINGNSQTILQRLELQYIITIHVQY